MTFSFSKVNLSLLEKRILKKIDFFFTFVHMNVQNFWYIHLYTVFVPMCWTNLKLCIAIRTIYLNCIKFM